MYKKTFFLAILFVILFYPVASFAQIPEAPEGSGASEADLKATLEWRPNVTIPGMDRFFKRKVNSDGSFSEDTYIINEGSIINYVQSLYSYAAILAGVIAMFMLVFAAYQWMLAAGNAEKIGRAKDTISGTLLGLTLLFGANLLLSQISSNLVDLEPLKIPIPTMAAPNAHQVFCQRIMDSYEFEHYTCGMPYATVTEDGSRVTCISTKCGGNDCVTKEKAYTDECPSAVAGDRLVACECKDADCPSLFSQYTGIDPCNKYVIDSDCKDNLCNGYPSEAIIYQYECGIDENNPEADCEGLDGMNGVQCFSDSWCNQGKYTYYEYYCKAEDNECEVRRDADGNKVRSGN